jgi:competence protein ComEA
VVLFESVRSRARADDAAAAHERLRALMSGPVAPSGWVPAAPDSGEADPPDSGEADLPALPSAAALPPSASSVPGGQLLDWRARLRMRPGAIIALVIVLVVAVVVAGALAWTGRARDVGAGLAAPQPPQQPGVPSQVAGDPSGTVVVDVTGRVRRPGLVTLPGGSRVADAIRAAGGVRPGTDLSTLNLARKLIDGEQIAVGVPGMAAPGPGAPPGQTNPVDLNTATATDLDALPGVGPVLAQRIVDWRAAHGGFTSVQQLRQVSGIGDSKFAELQGLVRV